MVSIKMPDMSDLMAGNKGARSGWHRLSCALRTIRSEGLLGSLGVLVSEWWFDVRRGTDTWWPAERGPGGDEAVPYQGVPVGLFRDLMDRVPQRERSGAFVDLGCGKGRALILAAEAGFRRLLGVDLDPGLVRICRRNLKKLRPRHGWPSVEVEAGNATQFQYPAGVCVVLLYNPFRGETLSAVARHLIEHDRTAGNRVWVIYVNPTELERLTNAGFRVVSEHRERGRVRGAVLRREGTDH